MIELVDDNASFERIINPFVANLRQIGIDASYRLIDPAQMQERQKHFDYDIIPGRLVMSLSPSIELRELFGSASADTPGTLNCSGVADPVVDALIEKIVAAKTRDELQRRGSARSTGCCARSRSGCRTGPRPATGSPTGTSSAAPTSRRPTARGDAFWWFDQAKYDKLKAEGALR